MNKPIKVAQTLPDDEGNFVTYYVMYSPEKDRWMLDIHFTGEMDSDFLKGLVIGFIEDCTVVDQDMFKMVDINQKSDLH